MTETTSDNDTKLFLRLMTCAAAVFCSGIAGCTLYEVRDRDNTAREAQLEQVVKVTCLRTGGNWVPLTQAVRNSSTASSTNMACVRAGLDTTKLTTQ